MPDQDPRMDQLRQAITNALHPNSDMSRGDLGAAVARIEGRAEPYGQPAVTAWLNTSDIPPDRVFAIEQALGKRPGSLSRLMGYVPVGTERACTVERALAEDPNLTATQREVVLGAYRAAVRGSKKRR